jgi:hypothetical protein
MAKQRKTRAKKATSSKGTPPTKRGRKTAFEREQNPYSVFPRTDLKGKEDDKGRKLYPYAWSYKPPQGGKHKKNLALKDPITGDSIYNEARAHEVAKALWKDMLNDKSRGDHKLAPRGSVNPIQVAANWFAHQQREKFHPSTIRRNRLFLNRLRTFTSFKHCKDITVVDATYLMALRDELKDADLPPCTRYPEGWKPEEEYIQAALSTLAALVGYATVYQSLATHFTALQKYLDTLPKYKSPEDRYYRPDQMARLERATREYMDKRPASYQSCVFILDHLYCGARLDEHLNMDVENVRLEGGDKYLDGELAYLGQKTERADQKGKKKKRNVVRYQPLFGPQIQFLGDYIETAALKPGQKLWPQRDGWADLRRAKEGKKVVWKNKGARRNATERRSAGPRDILKKICKMADVPYHGFHAFRTTYINMRARMVHPTSGRPLELWEVQDEVGHNSNVTKDVYHRPGFAHLPKSYTDLDWQVVEKDYFEARTKGKERAAQRRETRTVENTKNMKVYASHPTMLQRIIEEGRIAGM